MKKFISKKGMTLVELVVTIAILGIVSGFSITIVVTAMNNYTEAAIVQKEQKGARSEVYVRLKTAGRDLNAFIEVCHGLPNKDMEHFTRDLKALIEKYKR